MSIRRIKVSNFKSFQNLEVNLDNFNVLIGANAAGKSNFVQVFRFLRDITNHDLDSAISIQGGGQYLRNMDIRSEGDLSIEISSDRQIRLFARRSIEPITRQITYKLSLRFRGKGKRYTISDDRLTLKMSFSKMRARKRKKEQEEHLGEGEISIERAGGRLRVEYKLPEGVKRDDIYLPFPPGVKLPAKMLILDLPFVSGPPLQSIFSEIGIYDFDPKLPKKAVQITGKAELEENGSNIALVLKDIVSHKSAERKFANLMRDLLPFVEKVRTESLSDKSLLFKIQESYFHKTFIPASLISDGTINMTALIIALYFETKPLIIIEEPERNIHPYLISKIVAMIKDAATAKQILVTTQNPEVVRHAGLENILLVSRDKEGLSTISRPADKEEIKTFLRNEIGIEELYVQNLLEFPA